MTSTEFRQTHGDPAAWTTADHETYQVLRTNDAHLDQAAQQSAARLRTLLAPAAGRSPPSSATASSPSPSSP